MKLNDNIEDMVSRLVPDKSTYSARSNVLEAVQALHNAGHILQGLEQAMTTSVSIHDWNGPYEGLSVSLISDRPPPEVVDILARTTAVLLHIVRRQQHVMDGTETQHLAAIHKALARLSFNTKWKE